VVDDLSSGRLDRLGAARQTGKMTLHQLDIRAPELADVIGRFAPEVVFHLAAQISVRDSVDDPVHDASVNVVGTVNVLKAAAESGATRLVFSSSGGATFGDVAVFPTPETEPRTPESPYGVSKKIVDEYLRYFKDGYGLDYVSLGYANVFGPRQDPHGEAGVVAIFSQRMLRGERCTIFGDGSQRRDYVFVEDVTDACIRAANIGGGMYVNIGTGRETSVVELFEMLKGMTGYTLDAEFAEAKPGDIPRSCLDPGAAKAHLGWEPWTSIEDGLETTVEWFAANRTW
jgi:UDP-glucose 4-epimerase